jgi:hypothetical protein
VRFKALPFALLAAGLAASVAVAAPPPGKSDLGLGLGTPRPAAASFGGEDRRPRDGRQTVMLVLKGEFVSGSSDSTGVGSFAMVVRHANRHARALRGKQVTVAVDGKTRVRRQGPAALADLREHDRLVVHVRAAKRGDAASLELLARHVVARAPAGP